MDRERVNIPGTAHNRSYSPLGGGLLSGKYDPSGNQAKGRLTDNPSYVKRYGEPLYHEIAARFVDFARAQSIHPVTLAVAWVRSHPAITAPIIGARNLEQLQPALAAASLTLDSAARAAISALSYTPPLATDRSEEQQSPMRTA